MRADVRVAFGGITIRRFELCGDMNTDGVGEDDDAGARKAPSWIVRVVALARVGS